MARKSPSILAQYPYPTFIHPMAYLFEQYLRPCPVGCSWHWAAAQRQLMSSCAHTLATCCSEQSYRELWPSWSQGEARACQNYSGAVPSPSFESDYYNQLGMDSMSHDSMELTYYSLSSVVPRMQQLHQQKSCDCPPDWLAWQPTDPH